jgi:hypothetical protein
VSTVRNTLNLVRPDWLGRTGGPRAGMRGLWPVLVLAVLVVFACFFAIGRLSAGGGSPLEGSSSAPVARAAIPAALRGASPIAGAVPNAIAEPPPPPRKPARRSAEALRASATSRSLGGEGTSTEASSGSQSESAPVVEQAPAEAPAPSPSTGAGSSGGKSSGGSSGGSGGSRSAGGGSFDSSE